jgi:hypothetical protein
MLIISSIEAPSKKGVNPQKRKGLYTDFSFSLLPRYILLASNYSKSLLNPIQNLPPPFLPPLPVSHPFHLLLHTH